MTSTERALANIATTKWTYPSKATGHGQAWPMRSSPSLTRHWLSRPLSSCPWPSSCRAMARRIGLVSNGSEAPSDAQVMGNKPMHSICPMCKYSVCPLHIKINIYKYIYVHRSTWTVPLARASSLWSVAEVSCPWHNGFGPNFGLEVCNAIPGNGETRCSRFFLRGVAP